MKYLIILLFYVCSFQDNIYWENLSKEEQFKTLMSSSVNPIVRDYYAEKLTFSDNEKMFALIKEISNLPHNDNMRALYFHTFNDISMRSDGALSDFLSPYSYKIFIESPYYVIAYLNSHPVLLKTYGNMIGYELYFAETVDTYSETLKAKIMVYDEFELFVKQSLSEHYSLEKTVNDFLKIIRQTMKDME